MIANRLHYNAATLRRLLSIALPMMVSQGAFAVMIFTDRYFMSQISPTHMASALGGGVATFFSICFFTGLLSYANALAAQYLGAGEPKKCSRVVTQGLLLALASQPLLMIVAYFVVGLFESMGHDPTVVALERSYYLILMSGALITLSKACMSAYFAGIGRTRVVMVSDILGLLLNVPLCYGMAFGKFGFPEMGIEGAAISTLIATFCSLCFFAAYYFQRRNREEFSVLDSFRFDRGIMKRYLRLGLPSGTELFLNVAAFNLFLLMFQSYGVTQGASAAIVFNWDILSFVPLVGLNIGVVSMIGRAVGASDMEKTNEVISAAFLIALGYSSFLAVVYFVFRFPLVEVFAPPTGDFSEIRTLAAFMMIGLCSYTMGDAIIQVCGGVLRGAGDTRWVMISSAILHWAMLVAQYFIIRVFEIGPRASWIAFCVLIIAIAVVFLWRLFGGRWRDPETLRLVMAE